MNHINIQKWLYHVKHRYWNLNNAAMLVALVVAFSWVWGSIATMQRNYALQKKVDDSKRQLEITKLEVATLQYEQNYYKSDEYKDLSAREHLRLASPGEKVLILPDNSATAKNYDTTIAKKPTVVEAPPSNFEQWLRFLSGQTAPSTSN